MYILSACRYLHKKFKQQQMQSQDASTPTRRSSTSGEEDLSTSGVQKGTQNGGEEKASDILGTFIIINYYSATLGFCSRF